MASSFGNAEDIIGRALFHLYSANANKKWETDEKFEPV
jgi:hypothetical protein